MWHLEVLTVTETECQAFILTFQIQFVSVLGVQITCNKTRISNKTQEKS